MDIGSGTFNDCETLNISLQKADKLTSAMNKSASKKAELDKEIAAISEKLQEIHQKIELKETQIKECDEEVNKIIFDSFISH